MKQRAVVIVTFEGIQLLDLVGPHEVFAGANEVLDARQSSAPRYTLRVASADPGTVAGSSGLAVVAQALPPPRTPIDTLLIPGGDGAREMPADSPTVRWVASAAPHARRVATVCTGSFIAARAGLLDGRRVTTHWARAKQLQRENPGVRVDADPIYIRDGTVWSSAGVTAGIDLALALVEDDHDADLAQVVARWLVMYLHRPGGQSQFAVPTWTPRATRSPVREAQELVESEPGTDHRIGVLASRVGMSERNFTRVFREQVGEPPSRFVERVRVQTARALLERHEGTTAAIAQRCGFGTAETMRRAFVRHVGVAPDHYRRRFHTIAGGDAA